MYGVRPMFVFYWLLVVSLLASIESDCHWDDFKLKSVLGKGGHAVVFKAIHKQTGKHVALKIFKKTENQGELDREYSIQKSIGHPNVAQLHCKTSVGQGSSFKGRNISKGDTVFVLELVKGKSLRDNMKSGKLPVDPKSFTRNIMEILTYLRKHHVVFGDLSSANVMITDDGKVKLVDFGAALKIEHAVEPTPTFVSYKTRPHRWRNYAADWYSLGLLLEEILLFQQNGAWRDQRTFAGRRCSALIDDREACDLIKHLIPEDKNWGSIWGTTDSTLHKLMGSHWLD